jgi:hypothetical protein
MNFGNRTTHNGYTINSGSLFLSSIFQFSLFLIFVGDQIKEEDTNDGDERYKFWLKCLKGKKSTHQYYAQMG